MDHPYVLFVLIAVFFKANGLKCRMCVGIIDPRYCVQTTECAAGELCYTEQVIDDDLNIFYNVGCESTQHCNIAQQEGFGKREQLHVCEKCCNTEVCNNDTCSHPGATSTGQCLSCLDVANPKDCQTMIECRPDEMCFTQEFVNDQLQKRFRLGCEKIKRCELLGQYNPHERSTQLCNECCKHSGCNQFLCHAGSLSPQGTTVHVLGTTWHLAATTTRHATSTVHTTASSCVDSTLVQCLDLDATGNLCVPNSVAAQAYCPKYCKLC